MSKPMLLIASALIALSACNGGDPGGKPIEIPATVRSRITMPCEGYRQIGWDTFGGGDLHFTITPQMDSFEISLIQAQGILYDAFLIDESHDGEVYHALKRLFTGGMGLWTEATAQPTGSWTALSLTDSCGNFDRVQVSYFSDRGTNTDLAWLTKYIHARIGA